MQRQLSKQLCERNVESSKDSDEQYDQQNQMIEQQQTLYEAYIQSNQSTKSKISRISQRHTDLFDISENSISLTNITDKQQIPLKQTQIRQVSTSSETSPSQNLFWDESSVTDIKLLKISHGLHGQRQIENIVISTERYTNSTVDQQSSDSLFSSLF
ncbi:Hypothetical_protein [Hexamita inflata]|uniref:Hypothetical_protein n=1 Tax=Hexamita inflata TaxID=28002 RepID=A0AA86RE35_9EUKA|nr:Hypothetical protein HINF_LOCUS64324 [Hexamita inflata]